MSFVHHIKRRKPRLGCDGVASAFHQKPHALVAAGDRSPKHLREMSYKDAKRLVTRARLHSVRSTAANVSGRVSMTKAAARAGRRGQQTAVRAGLPSCPHSGGGGKGAGSGFFSKYCLPISLSPLPILLSSRVHSASAGGKGEGIAETHSAWAKSGMRMW